MALIGVIALVVGGYVAAARTYPYFGVVYVFLIVALGILGIAAFSVLTCVRARRQIRKLGA